MICTLYEDSNLPLDSTLISIVLLNGLGKIIYVVPLSQSKS
jgi:hypothetical protein